MMYRLFTRAGKPRSITVAAAMFVSGPMHTMLSSPGASAVSRSNAFTACSASSSTPESSIDRPPEPSPCTSSAEAQFRSIGCRQPMWTGTSPSFPATFRVRWALATCWSKPTLPATIVIARRSASGSSSPSRMVTQSSCAVSVSMMNGTRVMLLLSPAEHTP